jgi:hypothetical protein
VAKAKAEPVADESPTVTANAMLSIVQNFVEEHFPHSRASAVVISPAPGLPPVIVSTSENGCVPDIVGTIDNPRWD